MFAMKQIIIIEDETPLRELIAFNLSKSGFSTTEAPDANFALQCISEKEFDLILLDLMLPGLQGIDFLKIIKSNEKHKNIPVMIVSAKNSEKDIVAGLNTGADDYLTKPFSIHILQAKVSAMMRRQAGYISDILFHKGIEVNADKHITTVDGKVVKISSKEFQLLSMFIKYPGKVFTRSQLLDSIWGYDSEVYTRTVDVHISSLRKKLGKKGILIQSLPKIGYRMEVWSRF